MSKHTPGPWDAKDFRVCANFNPGDPPIKVICDTANNAKSRNDENRANARLIAAAPDLLAACQLALQFWYSDQPNDTPEAIAAKHAIRDAVNKATSP